MESVIWRNDAYLVGRWHRNLLKAQMPLGSSRHVSKRLDTLNASSCFETWRDEPSDIWDTAEARGIDTSDAALTQSTDCYNRLELLQLFSYVSIFSNDVSNHYGTGSGHDRATAARVDRNAVWQTMKCVCGDIQTMSHIVDFCPPTKLDCGLQRLHTSDKAALDWLTSYGTQKHSKHYVKHEGDWNSHEIWQRSDATMQNYETSWLSEMQ